MYSKGTFMQKNCLSLWGKELIEKIIQSPALTAITDAMEYRVNMSLSDHADRMHQWWAITRTFYLAGQQLLNTISLELLRAYNAHDMHTIQRLEEIRAKVDAVLADDGWHCRELPGAEKLHGFDTRHTQVHFHMFEEDISWLLRNTSKSQNIGLRKETLALMKGMETGFGKSLTEGFAWILIVELIAEEIVTKMLPYLIKIRNQGKPFFSKEQLFYCTYHILLEKLHAGDVTASIRSVADNPQSMEVLGKAVEKSLKLWENFWLSQSQIGT